MTALEAEQPVGEYPQLPCVARAYRSVDGVAAELAGVKAANGELARENVALAAKLEDARAEVSNVTDLLKASGHHVASLSDNVCMYQAERDELRDQLEELDDYRELQVRVQELEQELATREGQVSSLRTDLAITQHERDTAKTQAWVQR